MDRHQAAWQHLETSNKSERENGKTTFLKQQTVPSSNQWCLSKPFAVELVWFLEFAVVFLDSEHVLTPTLTATLDVHHENWFYTCLCKPHWVFRQCIFYNRSWPDSVWPRVSVYKTHSKWPVEPLDEFKNRNHVANSWLTVSCLFMTHCRWKRLPAERSLPATDVRWCVGYCWKSLGSSHLHLFRVEPTWLTPEVNFDLSAWVLPQMTCSTTRWIYPTFNVASVSSADMTSSQYACVFELRF